MLLQIEKKIYFVSPFGEVSKMNTAGGLKIYLKNALAEKRAELGLSQEQMAENLNISLRSYSNLEHGKYCCSLSTFISYVNNCNVDKDKLFSEIADILDNCDK